MSLLIHGEDEDPGPAGTTDNSLGRLLTLSDGVFAIAMTLLALNLKVPHLPGHSTDAELRHALSQNSAQYWAYLLSFYVVASYWLRHHRIMRTLTSTHPRLIGHNLTFLLFVAGLPFPASLLGEYGSKPTALAIYGLANAGAVLLLLLLLRDIERLDLSESPSPHRSDKVSLWGLLVVFVLCVPAGVVLGDNGPYVLLLLSGVGRLQWMQRTWRRWRSHRSSGREESS